jgi:membrane protein
MLFQRGERGRGQRQTQIGSKNMKTWEITKKTWTDFTDDDCPTMAAAVAYYAVFSLPSILLVVIFIAGSLFGRAAVEGQIQSRIGSTIGPQAASLIQSMVRSSTLSARGGIIALVFGIAGLLYSSTNVMAQLQTAIDRAWEVKPVESGLRSMAWTRFTSFLLVIGVGLLLMISLGASAAVTGAAGAAGISFPGWLMDALEIVISWVVFALLFGVLYKALPNARIFWSDVKVGAMITATFFIAGKFLIGLYLSHTGAVSAYGAAGALALLLLWTYYSATIFLVGAEWTQVWARQHGRTIEPREGAVKTGDLGPRRKAA